MHSNETPPIVRAADLRTERWRNGGGTTREIARGPKGAGADDWGWRISLADVDKAGPFSVFPGTERILTVVEGELLVLTVGGREQGLERHRPFRFDGGVPTSATLPTGGIRDLNVITSAGFRAHVAIVELSKKRPHPVFGGQHAVLLQGSATAGGGVALERYDAVVGSGERTPEVSGRGILAVVSIDAVAGETAAP
ncbi:HutD/Ves family protein [Arthrobacter sp. KK5.5]|uniref:HutD/Ves family protein n=1 Tax=Arthrobacter sp. KK5.5 TaxID=3373084 RepID=UPI003EE7267B